MLKILQKSFINYWCYIPSYYMKTLKSFKSTRTKINTILRTKINSLKNEVQIAFISKQPSLVSSILFLLCLFWMTFDVRSCRNINLRFSCCAIVTWCLRDIFFYSLLFDIMSVRTPEFFFHSLSRNAM